MSLKTRLHSSCSRKGKKHALIHTRSLSQADKLRTAGLCFPEKASLVFPTFTWMYHRGLGALAQGCRDAQRPFVLCRIA
jgi:hypothetical protein